MSKREEKRAEATERLSRFLDATNQRRTAVDGPIGPRCQTGDLYVCVVGTGLSPTAAVADWIDAFTRYEKGKPGSMLWRIRPRIEGKGTKWGVYSRVVIVPMALAKSGPQSECRSSRWTAATSHGVRC